jgi:hypothetical protein
MGQNLYNALLEKLDGKQLIIQFSDKSSSFDFEFGNGININIDYIESNHLFHEMWHAYQAYQETVDSYKEALLNLEIEAHYAQYLYLKKLPEYANGKWIRTYIKDPRHWRISEFDLYLEANDEFNFYIEDSVLKILLQDIIDVFHGIEEYKNYKFDYNRMNLSTLRNLNVLTKGC